MVDDNHAITLHWKKERVILVTRVASWSYRSDQV